MVNAEEKIYSVSEINSHVKDIIECSFNGYVIVEGEISQLNKAQSGHIYITLKDETSSVKCTLWSARVSKMQVYPKVGLKALIKCKVSFYEKNGTYQLDIVGISSVSTGKFHELFEKLKLKLKDEGLFDIKFKKNLPKYPKSISVITSLTGSVIQDILKIIERRLPGVAIEIYACNVQGENCPSSIIKQLIEINKKNSSDVIIIARGGGSLEDLIGYNDEYLARQIYNSKIPIITAVGHETDTTIVDLVSDMRAATPSEAAEIATRESVGDISNCFHEFRNRLDNILFNILNNKKYQLKENINSVEKNNPENKINNYNQTVDIYLETLKTKLLSNLMSERNKMNVVKVKLKSLDPISKISELESKINNNKEVLKNALNNIITRKKNIINLKNNRIKDINPLSILDKGYSIVYCDGKISNKISNFKENKDLTIRVTDGVIHSKVKEIKKN